jgi:hypothetical protein
MESVQDLFCEIFSSRSCTNEEFSLLIKRTIAEQVFLQEFKRTIYPLIVQYMPVHPFFYDENPYIFMQNVLEDLQCNQKEHWEYNVLCLNLTIYRAISSLFTVLKDPSKPTSLQNFRSMAQHTTFQEVHMFTC